MGKKTSSWENVPEDINEHLGFVYIITHIPSGKYYIGKKQFFNKTKYPPLKGRKNKRIRWVESDWETYTGSSNKFNKFVEKEGIHSFRKEMLAFADSKFDLSYKELLFQLSHDVLNDINSYNEIINVRLRKAKKH